MNYSNGQTAYSSCADEQRNRPQIIGSIDIFANQHSIEEISEQTDSPIQKLQDCIPPQSTYEDCNIDLIVHVAPRINIASSSGYSECYVVFDVTENEQVESILSKMSGKLEIELELFTKCFAVWVSSPLLDMQLKPHHKPIKILGNWLKYLEQYASYASKEDVEQDSPVICIRRNVHLSRQDQADIRDVSCLEILYADAQNCVLRGDYSMDVENNIKLVGMSFAAECKKNDIQLTVEQMKKQLDDHLPEHSAQEIFDPILLGKTFSKKSRMSEVFKMYRRMMVDSLEDIYREYLNMLMVSCPSYGCATFRMVIEKPENSKFKNLFSLKKSTEVIVGVNNIYLTISRPNKSGNLLVVQTKDVTSKVFRIKNRQIESTVLVFPVISADRPIVSSSENDRGIYSNPSSSSNKAEDPSYTMVQLFGSTSELLHAFLKAMKSHTQNGTSDFMQPCRLVSPCENMCTASLKNGIWSGKGSLRQALSSP